MLRFPADVYLEGSDQHRGWFNSSLMVAVGTRGTAPYRAVITNGVKPIVFYPASAFTRERTSDGQGFRVTFTGPEGDYGVVEIGRETTMFVASGEYVEFDASGNVVRSNGISYHYHPLFDALHNVDPVRDGTDASPSLSRHR